ncbi:MAG: serine/threonine protein kinase [Kiritimatiellia bacterium]|jgi:serine/threonine protein kinase
MVAPVPKPLFELADGRYVALEVLGRGGNSTVYRCLDTKENVERALKVRLPGRGYSANDLNRRMHAEADAMQRIAHPRLLPVYDHGVDGSMHYVVMSLAPGGSLAGYLERHGRLGPSLATRHMTMVLQAVQAAHDASVVHRDLKPDNILLDAKGEPLLADFGIAKVRRDDTPTFTGATLGSLAYMAPEQRANAHNVGPTADIYAAGATLFNLVTCNSPVDLFACPPSSPRWDGVPKGIREALHKACSYYPDDRYKSATEFADVLRALIPSLPERPIPTAARRNARDGDTLASAPRRTTTPHEGARGRVAASPPGVVPKPLPINDSPPQHAQSRMAVPAVIIICCMILICIMIGIYLMTGL